MISRALALGFAGTLLVVTGCAGDGSELDTMMPPGGIQPTLESIQLEVFTPICAQCHFPGGPGPMPLDSADASFANLVNVPSLRSPLLRVAPQDPDNSFLVHKIEGREGIAGQRMPPPQAGPPLTGEQIQAIRQWITDGALR